MNDVANRATGALAAIAELKRGLQNVKDTLILKGGEPLLRMLTDGTWVYGAENIEVQDGSYWQINPLSIEHGWSSWTKNDGKEKNELVGEVMVPFTQPLPPKNVLNDTGWPWAQQISFQLKCINGDDVGEQTKYKARSVGSMDLANEIINKLLAQLEKRPELPCPVVEMSSDTYQHKVYGKTYTPLMTIVKWASMDGPDGGEEDVETAAAAAAPKGRTRRAPATPATTTKAPVEQTKAIAEDPNLTRAISKAEIDAALAAEKKAKLQAELAALEEPEPVEETPAQKKARLLAEMAALDEQEAAPQTEAAAPAEGTAVRRRRA